MKPIVKNLPISAANAAPIPKDKGEYSLKGKRSESSMFNVSTTQAIFIACLLVFVLVIAIVVGLIGWVSRMLLQMQNKHQTELSELQRQNTNLQA